MQQPGPIIIIASRRRHFYTEHGVVLLAGIAGLLLHASDLHTVATSLWPLAAFLPFIAVGLVRMAIHRACEKKADDVMPDKPSGTIVADGSRLSGSLRHFDVKGRG